ncbi:MAG: type II toxin-antitoxin system ParD family antitoxin [bacterium]|nr:type II toxin-antitoxin system ParD family antitoxin [bacterium]
MNVSLTPELEELVQGKVASGLYNSNSEVVREALRLMAKRDAEENPVAHRPRKGIAKAVRSRKTRSGKSGRAR